jgi:polysaccharide deacetylase 2 family uncharacterized protein YibQ
MALTPKGYAQPFSAIGRDIFIKSFAKTNATQAELNALVQAVQLTSTITAIGSFTAGTSDVVNMIIEGKDVGDLAGFTASDMSF